MPHRAVYCYCTHWTAEIPSPFTVSTLRDLYFAESRKLVRASQTKHIRGVVDTYQAGKRVRFIPSPLRLDRRTCIKQANDVTCAGSSGSDRFEQSSARAPTHLGSVGPNAANVTPSLSRAFVIGMGRLVCLAQMAAVCVFVLHCITMVGS